MNDFDREKFLSVSLMVLGVVLLASLQLGCSRSVLVRHVQLHGLVGDASDISEQLIRTVEIQSTCMGQGYRSSGAVIADSTILAASHAIHCTDNIRVTLSTGTQLRAVVQKRDSENDIVLLRTLAVVTVPKVRYAEDVKRGDVVCASVANPNPGRICGMVARVANEGPGALITGLDVVPGNSGSAVYNAQGELVGVVSTGCRLRGCGLSGTSLLSESKERLGL